MKHWQWLSKEISFKDALAGVQLAAQMLRCRPLVQGLSEALLLQNDSRNELSIAVTRRWLLTLKAMTWLENALTARWELARPQDLACLAFKTVKPEWPRRQVSVSHRSFEVKPLLQQSRAWKSHLFAIDAIYVPSWETNNGMIWGLFALSPIITIINSPAYTDSEWCRRELELINFLFLQCDFHPGRKVRMLEPAEIKEFDKIEADWFQQNNTDADFKIDALNNFPPLCYVYTPSKNEEWQLRMLRAAGLLRLLHAVLLNPGLANQVCQYLLENEADPPVPAYTNHPGVWQQYKKILVDLSAEFDGPRRLHMMMPENLKTLNPDESQKVLDSIPDLSSGIPAFEDVLVALEWMESLLPILEDASFGGMILIDLRGITQESWEADPALSLARGIAALRQPPKPVWFIQAAGQEIEKWGLLGGDLPIFTQHTENQYDWMWDGTLSPDWPAYYAARCGLQLSEALNENASSQNSHHPPMVADS
jgi:hypothetical protein